MPAISELRRRTEDHRAAFVRHIADDVSRQIESGGVAVTDARELAARVRFQAGLLFPCRMEAYDRIYSSRFERQIRQFLLGES